MTLVIVPSRGRPTRAADMVKSVHDTAAGEVRVIVAVDPDDPELAEYQREISDDLVVLPERLRFVATINRLAAEHWDEHDIIGAYGDDVIFRTPGWDLVVRGELAKPGIAFGNDLAHRDGFPTAVFMSSAIAKALGWFALPACRHLYVDNVWQIIGTELGLLRYMPDVVFEHMHEVYGKAPMDETYRSVYDDNGKHDYEAFEAWRALDMAKDVARLKKALRS